ncbi:MAG: hypothetical protein ABS23_03010 [SAR92 bacterium BACL16 MAG-120619-bin48]|nr:MAG: hypothetical protein ABS23_03010 [SAR92 bacterium BACL16 MAG-120619-bin48]
MSPKRVAESMILFVNCATAPLLPKIDGLHCAFMALGAGGQPFSGCLASQPWLQFVFIRRLHTIPC